MTGEYITFMDIDDEIHPSFIETLVDKAIGGYEIILCNYCEVHEGRKRDVLLPWKDETVTRETIHYEMIPEMISGQKYSTIPGRVWRTFINRSFLESQDIWFDKKVSIAEDMLFTIQLYARAERIFICSDVLYYYMTNQGSAIHSYRQNYIKENIYSHKALIRILKVEGLYETCKDRCVRPFMRMYTYAITNAVRNPNMSETRCEMKQIRSYFLAEDSYSILDTREKLYFFAHSDIQI